VTALATCKDNCTLKTNSREYMKKWNRVIMRIYSGIGLVGLWGSVYFMQIRINDGAFRALSAPYSWFVWCFSSGVMTWLAIVTTVYWVVSLLMVLWRTVRSPVPH
jgi:hypothetical protein